MSGTLDFIEWLFSMNPATAFIIVIIATLAAMGLWHAYRAWLRRRDERVWNDGYHSGVLAGRRQERVETAYVDHPFTAAALFFNTLGSNVAEPVDDSQPRPCGRNK